MMSDIWSLLAETFGSFAADRSFRSTRFLYDPAGFDDAGGAPWLIDGVTASHIQQVEDACRTASVHNGIVDGPDAVWRWLEAVRRDLQRAGHCLSPERSSCSWRLPEAWRLPGPLDGHRVSSIAVTVGTPLLASDSESYALPDPFHVLRHYCLRRIGVPAVAAPQIVAADAADAADSESASERSSKGDRPTAQSDSSRTVTLKQAAKALNTSTDTLIRAYKASEIELFKLRDRGRWLVRASEIHRVRHRYRER